jgi:uncharacterized protein (DUF2147 family)
MAVGTPEVTRTGLLSTGVMLCLASTARSQPASGPGPWGEWVRQDGLSRIRVTPCSDKICAVNTWVKDPDGDEKVGDMLVMTLHGRSPSELSGRAHDERRDINFSMTISFGPAGMRTHGCMMLGLLCRTAEWIRVR